METTKLAKLKAAWVRGDRMEALRIAAKFPQLGDAKEAITRAWAASTNPALYESMGKDVASLIESGMQAIAARYNLT